LVAAIPLPVDEQVLRTQPEIASLSGAARRRAIAAQIFSSRRMQRQSAGSIQTAFVQLAYPWLLTREAGRLPGAVEAPDAMLTGLIANNALTEGTWRTLAREPVPTLLGVAPLLTRQELDGDLPYQSGAGSRRIQRSMRERVSVFGPAATGLQLLSDVTTDDDEAYRPANVNRLVAAIVKTARLIGEDVVFANSGEALWRQLRSGLESLLLGLWGAGALDGAAAAEAFDVRCDRSTMTQNDLDAGRVIARIELSVAHPIERITVVLAMDEGGQVSLVSAREAAEVTA
jgi:phage tail sheath protein FI